jgi:esterase/lipase superfamily enzyme
VFSINSINNEAWLNDRVHPRDAAVRQQAYNGYITEEVVPYIWSSCNGRFGIITTGASLGAFHCANQVFRRPDLFDGMIAMSGSYDIRGYYHGDHYDDNVYFNNPVDYLPNLNDESSLVSLRSKRHLHLVTGQGLMKRHVSRRLAGILSAKVSPRTDIWGIMPHDWSTWRAMLPHYLATLFRTRASGACHVPTKPQKQVPRRNNEENRNHRRTRMVMAARLYRGSE